MKQLITLLFFSITLGKVAAQNVFTKVPTLAHTHEVDIFFLHELPIKEPYFKTQMIETDGNDYNDAIVQIKQKAQLVGADVVIIMNYDRGHLIGIGAKYKKNMTTLDSTVAFLKTIRIIPINNNKGSGDVQFDIDGTLKPNQNRELVTYFEDNILNYDFDFLIQDKSARWQESPDIYNRIERRKLKNTNGVTVKKIFLSYATDSDKIPQFLEVDDINKSSASSSMWHTEKLFPIYNSAGKLTELKVFWKNALVRRQQLFYDAKNRLIMSDWVKFENQKPIPFLRVEYEYYKNADLKL
ncbi:hypothetical protein VB776_05525 [Arcicella sp. DC2W]|uniref:TPM domain-containing protein n=1 Tax=Arcicella gelida TaxID=2984195 RepID=A0ABU5S1P2_9BACT|nr:hypothetical protein [Arcicella sp. DC2W]MEA5402362.1 hypothetical protein [Arcicella sp. DC2W]